MSQNRSSGHGPWWSCPGCIAWTAAAALVLALAGVGLVEVAAEIAGLVS